MARAKALVHFCPSGSRYGPKKHNLFFRGCELFGFSRAFPRCNAPAAITRNPQRPGPRLALRRSSWPPLLSLVCLSVWRRREVGRAGRAVDSSVSRRVGGGRGREHCPEDCLPPSPRRWLFSSRARSLPLWNSFQALPRRASRPNPRPNRSRNVGWQASRGHERRATAAVASAGRVQG